MNWKLWLEGLGSAALGGAVTGATQALSSGTGFTSTTGIAAALGALLGVGLYLKPPATTPPPPVVQPPIDPPLSK